MRMPRAVAGALTAAMLWAAPALADRAAQVETLIGALRIGDTVRIMREEGLAYGDELAREMMPEADMDSWQDRIGRLYDADRMRDLVAGRLAEELEGVPLAPLNAFFTSEPGQEIIGLEIAARESFLDEEFEMAARDRYRSAVREEAAIIGRIDTLVADSDLIERNVTGILNASLMLYRGLADGGAYELSDEEILADVWSQEEDVREDSAEWIGAYLLTAYRPLEPGELDRYIELWRTEEGRALNRALFTVFDRMYEEISYLVGQAAAQHMRSQEL